MTPEMVPVDCYPWVLAAFFVGYTGRRGVDRLLAVLGLLNAVPDARSSSDGDEGNEYHPVEYDDTDDASADGDVSDGSRERPKE